MLTFETLRRENVARCEEAFHPLDSWSPTDWATAMAGEVGEACNLIKKMRRRRRAGQWDELSRDEAREVVDELADAVIYADLLAARLRESLAEAVVRKFSIVSQRVGSPRRLVES